MKNFIALIMIVLPAIAQAGSFTGNATADTLEKLERLLPWNVALETASEKVAQYG